MTSDRRIASSVAIVAAISTIVAIVTASILLIGSLQDVARNYNEGWMIETSARFLSGEVLYSSADSVVSTNYPPLWYLFLAAVGSIGLDMNAVGRIVEAISLFACGGLVYLVAQQLGAVRWIAIASGATFLGLATSWLPAYIGINDPHLSGLAIMLLGAWLALKRTPAFLIMGALACCIAGFTKHSLLPIPISLSLYFLLTDRRAFTRFVGALALMTTAGLLVCTLIWGADFWNGIAPARAHELWRLRLHVERNVPLYLAIATSIVGAIGLLRVEKRVLWPMIYLTVATAIGLYAQLIPGASLNHLYESLVAISVMLAVSSSVAIKAAPRMTFPAWAILGACVLTLSSNVLESPKSVVDRARLRVSRNQEAQMAIHAIAGYSGRVACEDAILCIRSGKFSALDFYNVGQQLEVGTLQTDDVLRTLERMGVEAIQFYRAPGQSDRLPDDTIEALLKMFPQRRISGDHYSVVERRCAKDTGCAG